MHTGIIGKSSISFTDLQLANGQRMLPPSADGQIPRASVVMAQYKKNKAHKQ
jgi:hypothetical protein